MRTRMLFSCPLLLLSFAAVLAQQPPRGPDPLREHLFPPELIMQNQKALGLTDQQRDFIKSEMQKAQSRFTDAQWQLQTEMETMQSSLKEEKADEQQVLSQLEKILALEREIKRTQIGLVVRIKNRLTPEQQAKLREIKSTMDELQTPRPDRPGRPGREGE